MPTLPEFPDWLEELDTSRVVRCRGPNCRAACYLGRTKKGARILIDCLPVDTGQGIIAHFASCPDADRFKRRKGGS